MSSKLKKWYVVLGLTLGGLAVCVLLLTGGGLIGGAVGYAAARRGRALDLPGPWRQMLPQIPEAQEAPDLSPQVPQPRQALPQTLLESFSGQLWAAVVVDVDAEAPAGEAGLEAGDLIFAVDDKAMNQERDLRALIGSHQPGDEVTVTLVRPGDDPELMDLEVTLGTGTNEEGEEVARLGLEYRSVSTGLGVFLRRGMPWSGELPRTD
jgi:membrane-associated protease RseP (regulator of RpoE activity)